MRTLFLFSLLLFSFMGLSQTKIKGIITNTKGEPIFATNVYLKSDPQNGTITNFDGKFVLNLSSSKDTLLVTFIGYKTKEIKIDTIDFSKPLNIILEENTQSLNEVLITANNPISEKFSVIEMDMIQNVYLNPVSQGDPLKAITILPASTTTNETANPSLRGSSADRTRVMLNGVPIYKPVRASQLNNQGFFSLFNPELIGKQYIYASNPPLTYGNTSAGLIEIQTIQKLDNNQLQLSVGLANVGFLLSNKMKKHTSFIQVYGNYQFSTAFTGIQKEKLPTLRGFNTWDAGINFHKQLSKKVEFNSYNYFIDEAFHGIDERFTYTGEITSGKQRFFSVNNLKIITGKGILSINTGTNTSTQNFKFGNIFSKQNTSQYYSSIDYKWYLLEATDLQFGISYDYHKNSFIDSIPEYYYALSKESPNYPKSTYINNHIIEMYVYTNWNIHENLTLSSGIRSNIPLENQRYYLSSQLGLKYKINNRHSFLFSGGKYHNYSIPNYFSKSYDLLLSHQIALDYTFESNQIVLKSAIYFKNETGEQSVNAFYRTDKVNTFGLEVFMEHGFHKYFKFSLANSFLNQKITIEGKEYPGLKDLRYHLKISLQYNNPRVFTLAISYTTRPGMFYNEITGSSYDNRTGFYEPFFSEALFTGQYDNYHRFDLNVSKYVRLKNHALIVFLSINNLFDNTNQRQVQYNSDYSLKHFDYYQFRTVYFGIIWQLIY